MFHSKLVYDESANCQSRVCSDFTRVVNRDEKGDEYITFEKFDYPQHQASLGSVDDWSLKSLLSAGINPDFGIKTGFNTRLEGVDVVDSAISQINEVFDSENNKNE